MNNPEYVKIGEKKYKINTDFRIAIECNDIATNTDIGQHERALAIIYKLFGDEGLNDEQNHERLLFLAKKYLNCDKEQIDNSKTKIELDMDFKQDIGYIKSSFKYDYRYDPYELEYLHWYDFFNDLCNLSNDEYGTCCVLSKIRNLRNLDLKTIKDPKDREKMKKAKEAVALKKKNVNKKQHTQEEQENINDFLSKIRKE